AVISKACELPLVGQTFLSASAPLPPPRRVAKIRRMIYRIDVRTDSPAREGDAAAVDPVGEAVRQQIKEFGHDLGNISTRRIFLIDTDADEKQVRRVADELRADPIVERAEVVDAKTQANGTSRTEIHL